MLFSFEGRGTKSSITRRRTQRPRRDIDLDKFSQVLRGSANEDLTAKTRFLYLICFSMGSQCSCLRTGLVCSSLRNLRMSLAEEFCTCWSGLMIFCG